MLSDDYMSNLSDSDKQSTAPNSRPFTHNASHGGLNGNNNGTAPYSATTINPFNASTTVRSVATVTAGVAKMLVDMFAHGSENAEAGVAFISSSSYSNWQNLTQIFQMNFGVKVTLLSATDEVAQANSGTESKKVVMYGEQAAIILASQQLQQAEKAHLQAHSSKEEAKNKQLRNRQSIVLTNDWRFKSATMLISPHASNVDLENGAASAQFGSFDAYFANKLRSVPDMSCLNVLNHTDLPVGVNGGSGVEITENVRKTLLLNLQQLCARLDFTPAQAQQALMVLLRYLRYVTGNVVKESTSIVAAVALLVAKHSADFKYKHVSTVVRSAYCAVFRRDEADVTISSIEHYVDATLEKEKHIYNKVYKDMFSADVLPFLHNQVKVAMWGDKWRFEVDNSTVETDISTPNNSAQKDKHKDREVEKQKRKKNATFQYEMNIRYGVRRSVLHVGESVARDLLNVFSTSSGSGGGNNSISANISDTSCSMVLSVLPVEVVQLSCILVVSLLHTTLPSVAVHKRIINEVDTYAAELVHTALHVLHYSAQLLQWCTEVFSEACLDQLVALCEGYDCFKELRDSRTDMVRLLRVTIPGVLGKIITAVTSTNHTIGSFIVSSSASNHASHLNAPPLPAAPLPPPPSSSLNPSQLFQDSDVTCKHRFPWLTTSENSEINANGSSGGVSLHPSLTVSAFQDGKYSPSVRSGEGDSPLVPCAKVMYFIII